MAALPSGTVTFLFTDIEGSSRRWEADAEGMSVELRQHDELLRSCVEANGGAVFKMVGDACCAAFSTAREALDAALAMQRALAETYRTSSNDAIQVRIALHTGSADERDGDYYGPSVNRVARLLSAGYGSQILLSAATQELVRDRLPSDVTLRGLGEHRLKDLARPEHIFQVTVPDQDHTFPPLKTVDASRTNLPIQTARLIGRVQELREVCELLRADDVRLITLTGPAGTGKTRLSLQVAAELLDDFRDGAFFVSLASVTDPGEVVPAVARSLNLPEADRQRGTQALTGSLGRSEMLLVLDNFEQVLEAAPVVAAILQACPGTKVMATSREPLHLYDEQQYVVPPLSVPELAKLPNLEALSQYESVALFIQRAQMVKRDFAVTNENAPAVAEICYRLDGLPLAIELAAARVVILAPQAILIRLSHCLNLLSGGARDLPARHQTLRGALDWSYGLLSEPEQRLLRRLGVFYGGWTLEAAEEVCNIEGDLDVFEGMTSLVEKSLVRTVIRPDPRYEMLETIREYAREALTPDEARELPRRHASFFVRFAMEAGPELIRDQGQWLERLEADHENLRAATTSNMR